MNTTENTACGSQAVKIFPMLVWSGLGLCAAAATIYDLRDMVGW